MFHPALNNPPSPPSPPSPPHRLPPFWLLLGTSCAAVVLAWNSLAPYPPLAVPALPPEQALPGQALPAQKEALVVPQLKTRPLLVPQPEPKPFTDPYAQPDKPPPAPTRRQNQQDDSLYHELIAVIKTENTKIYGTPQPSQRIIIKAKENNTVVLVDEEKNETIDIYDLEPDDVIIPPENKTLSIVTNNLRGLMFFVDQTPLATDKQKAIGSIMLNPDMLLETLDR